jgi:hypothetical protein
MAKRNGRAQVRKEEHSKAAFKLGKLEEKLQQALRVHEVRLTPHRLAVVAACMPPRAWRALLAPLSVADVERRAPTVHAIGMLRRYTPCGARSGWREQVEARQARLAQKALDKTQMDQTRVRTGFAAGCSQSFSAVGSTAAAAVICVHGCDVVSMCVCVRAGCVLCVRVRVAACVRSRGVRACVSA